MTRGWLVCGAFLGVLVACASSYEADDGAAEITFEKKVSPFEGFAAKTGPVPPTGPAQLSLSASAGGSLTIEGKARGEGGKLVGSTQAGKLALDVKFALDGSLKLEAGPVEYDGDIPGLKDVSIPVAGTVAFDPFLIGKSTEVVASIPKTDLPPIPIGATPAKLHLTVVEKSEVRVGFRGACVKVTGGAATWQGLLAPKGTIVLKGTIKVDVPGIQPIPVPEFKVPITLPEQPIEIPASAPVSIADATEGQCGAKPEPAVDAGPVDGGPAPDGSTNPPEEPPPTKDGGPTCVPVVCPGANLGTIRGDIGADTRTFAGQGSQYVYVHVDEGTKELVPLKITAEIEPKGLPGAVYIKSYPNKSCSLAANVASGSDLATTMWTDVSGAENARDYVILVEKPCVSWTLKVHR